MARPRIFISSTYYDLKHIRASLDLFVDSLGFEPVLSEKGDIAYTPDRPLDESCYREVENSDVLVLIIGGRYGSEASSGNKRPNPAFFDRYESITKKEYEAALTKDIPIYILVEKGVHSEYQTFQRNKDRTDINYAHVQSVNVFLLIEDILSRPRNNPVQTFEKFDEVETWLREQWAGLFRELLRRQSQQQQLAGLTAQVGELKEVNETLKKYLEAVMKGAGKNETGRLIQEEERRLEEARQFQQLKNNRFVSFLRGSYDLEPERIFSDLKSAKDLAEFLSLIQDRAKTGRSPERIKDTLSMHSGARDELNLARMLTHQPPFDFEKELDRPIRDSRRELRSQSDSEEPSGKAVAQPPISGAVSRNKAAAKAALKMPVQGGASEAAVARKVAVKNTKVPAAVAKKAPAKKRVMRKAP